MSNATKPKSLLSKKDRESSPWQAQVQKLRRIAVRATAKADWLEELGEQSPEFASSPSEIRQYRDKAAAAAEEMVAIAKANGDPRAAKL